jgi:WD40 repeat protein
MSVVTLFLKRDLNILMSVVLCLLFGQSSVCFGIDSVKILHLSCDGEISVSNGKRIDEKQDRISLGDVPRGLLYRKEFLAINKNQLYSTDISIGNTNSLLNFEGVLRKDYFAWRIGYADDKIIILNASKHDQNKPINKQTSHYYLYEIDRRTRTIRRLPILDCTGDMFSASQNKIYYSSENWEINEYSNSSSKKVGIKGRFPSVSPDGNKLAYAAFGLLKDGIFVYDSQKKTKTVALKSFGPDAFEPILRWSADSQYLAIKESSDISRTPLYVFDTLKNNIAFIIEGTTSCNWFFMGAEGIKH